MHPTRFASLSLSLLLVASLSSAAPRRDVEPRAHDLDAALEGVGALHADLQAPPPTAEEVLVARLEQMGASSDAAWEVVARLAPWQATAQAGDAGLDLSDLAASSLANLGISEDALPKAARLADAYVMGRPVSLEGIDLPGNLRERIGQLQADGIGAEMAAWLARQELAASQASADPAERMASALALLDVSNGVRARLSTTLRTTGATSLDVGAYEHVVGFDAPEVSPIAPTAACSSCPMFQYGTFVPGQNWASHLSAIGPDDCRVYRFSVTSGRNYRFTLCEGGGTANFTAAIESSTYQGNVCGAGPSGVTCSGTRAVLDYTATYTGFFFVKVRNLNVGGSGYSYRLAYADLSPACKSCPAYDYGAFTPGANYQTHSSSIGFQQCRVYKFLATIGRTYRFTLCPTDSSGIPTGATTSFQALVTARGADCSPIGGPSRSPCDSDHEIDVTATSSFIYVEVGSESGDFGTFTLAYRDLARCASCPASDFGAFTPTTTYQRHSSSIAQDKCRLYKFLVTAGVAYRFVTCATDLDGNAAGGAAGFDTVLDAYNPACEFLAANDDGCGFPSSHLDIVPSYTGALFIRVRGFSQWDAGSYTLAYRRTAGACRACGTYDVAAPPPTPSYQTLPPSTVELDGGCRMYRFYLLPAYSYRFTLCDPDSDGDPTGASATFDSVIEMMNTGCSLVASNDDACGWTSELDYTPTGPGYHWVRVRGASPSDAGSFVLAFKRRPLTPACGGTFDIAVSGPGFLDETEWALTSDGGALLGSGGPYGFGTSNAASVAVADGDAPVDFAINTVGFFSDNIASWSVSCNGTLLASGFIGGGSVDGATDLCCP